ncbi:MAG: 5-(carboxyamino)imidazole ribonucleotide mutase [Sulfolobales archaeon]|nr:5-(carboxyamino)imidazole ribonucleotide mutase [Sulfolobales archaeon]MDW8082884.1 5-(carboxyamino)imidazole ribonucleotide mutase [Sulfolobales archaeon]
MPCRGKVSIVIGSERDRPHAERAATILRENGIEHEIVVLSAHRNPKELERYIETSDADLFIAMAGLAAHLPGFIASRTRRPVIGVPLNVALGGLDSLLSIVQMPRGVPVATVGIDNAENAAYLAIRVLHLCRS